MTRVITRRVGSVGIALALVMTAASCGSDAKQTASSSAATSAASAAITVSGAWARTSPANATAGAAYMTLTSATADRLVGVKADTSVSAKVEIHETVAATEGTTAMGSDATTAMGTAMGSDATTAMGSDATMPMSGEMMMRPVHAIDLAAGQATELKPGGYHIMLIDLVKPLEVGTTLKLTLMFENAAEMVVDVPVLAEAP